MKTKKISVWGVVFAGYKEKYLREFEPDPGIEAGHEVWLTQDDAKKNAPEYAQTMDPSRKFKIVKFSGCYK